jgi:hypothetical protein
VCKLSGLLPETTDKREERQGMARDPVCPQAHICQPLASGHRLAKARAPYKTAFRRKCLTCQRPLRYQGLLKGGAKD